MVCQIEIGRNYLTPANIFYRFHNQKRFRFFILLRRVQWRFSFKTTSFRKAPYQVAGILFPLSNPHIRSRQKWKRWELFTNTVRTINY
jgi:hypothetical protein